MGGGPDGPGDGDHRFVKNEGCSVDVPPFSIEYPCKAAVFSRMLFASRPRHHRARLRIAECACDQAQQLRPSDQFADVDWVHLSWSWGGSGAALGLGTVRTYNWRRNPPPPAEASPLGEQSPSGTPPRRRALSEDPLHLRTPERALSQERVSQARLMRRRNRNVFGWIVSAEAVGWRRDGRMARIAVASVLSAEPLSVGTNTHAPLSTCAFRMMYTFPRGGGRLLAPSRSRLQVHATWKGCWRTVRPAGVAQRHSRRSCMPTRQGCEP